MIPANWCVEGGRVGRVVVATMGSRRDGGWGSGYIEFGAKWGLASGRDHKRWLGGLSDGDSGDEFSGGGFAPED